MKAEDYEEKYSRFMWLEKLKFALSCALGFLFLFAFLFSIVLFFYFLFVDVLLFRVLVYEFPDIAGVLISPMCRYVTCFVIALLAVLMPKGL